ncbi:hypothetical protein HY086_00360 [Candidatus Gottesmanbacteria bacterium]|nr:hypothetical protein [Candidatus Gottesmanbacteria bacterium]
MLKKLESSGHIVREPYRGFTLTPKGRAIGAKIQKRHRILSEFLHLLHVPRHVIEHDIEGLEHDLSDQTLAVLEKLIRQLKRKKRN